MVTVTLATERPRTVFAVAPEPPPPPLKVTRGAAVYPLPGLVTAMLSTEVGCKLDVAASPVQLVPPKTTVGGRV